VPAMGYTTYRIVSGGAKAPAATALKVTPTTLENEFFKVTLNQKTGNISSLIDKRDKRDKREYFGGGAKEGNLLQCYRDQHPEYDAWNIRLHEELPVALAGAPEVVEKGPVRVTLKLTKTIGKSTFAHYISLVAGVPQVFAKLDVDWRESHVMAKMAFRLNLLSDNAWYEIPYAAISRAAIAKTDADKAKWEVSAQKWVDYPSADGKTGFSILNNSKYGYDTKDNVMRISLLRSPKAPDSEADMGKHTIEYSLYPHAADWRKAQTPRRGLEFNTPLIPLLEPAHKGALPAAASYYKAEPDNVILIVVKRAEDSNADVLRLYEATGKDSKAKITLPAKAKKVLIVNLMEEGPKEVKANGAEIDVPIGHYEILTLKVDY
jgi:alpha-mannosidase